VKHQYFGDINDYRKYGILRGLTASSGLKLGVAWMLTPDDSRSDGGFTAYLADSKMRRFDPDLFDRLNAAVRHERRLDRVRDQGILSAFAFDEQSVPDDAAGRGLYFSRVVESMRAAEFVFLDPDNGIEVRSCPPGRKRSSKYVLRAELRQLYAQGKSLLVYQHFRREKRCDFVRRVTAEVAENLGCEAVSCLQAANVAFLLAAQPGHSPRLTSAARLVERAWAGEIRLLSATPP